MMYSISQVYHENESNKKKIYTIEIYLSLIINIHFPYQNSKKLKITYLPKFIILSIEK